MKKEICTLALEPESQFYCKILDYALNHVRVGILVVRSDMPLSAHGADVIQQLKPFTQRSVVSDEWPGTKLLNGSAVVHCWAYNEETVAILKQFSNRLYQWQQPEYPEDLCLMRSYNEPWLVSISHERDAYLVLDEVELANLMGSIPELIDIVTMENH